MGLVDRLYKDYQNDHKFTLTTFSLLVMNDMGDSLNASYYHIVNPLTAVGAEVSHSFSSNEKTIIVGAQHALDPLTTYKASALVQHEWRPKSFFTVFGEVDTKVIEKTAKAGLVLALKS